MLSLVWQNAGLTQQGALQDRTCELCWNRKPIGQASVHSFDRIVLSEVWCVSEISIHSRPHGTVTVDDDLAKVDFWETKSEKPIISCQDAGGSKLVP